MPTHNVPFPSSVTAKRLFISAIVFLSLVVIAIGARAQSDDPPGEPPDPPSELRSTLAGQVELAHLVDLCAQRLNLQIEYDAATLRGTEVTLRLGVDVSDEELWTLTNQLLASRDLTSVQMPGHDVLSIVRLQDAISKARVEETLPPQTRAGFVTVLIDVEHRATKDVIDALKTIVSKQGGAVVELAEGRILLSDLRPRVDQALWLLEQYDVPGDTTIVEIIEPEYVSASQLATAITATVVSRNTLEPGPGKLVGRLTPLVEGEAVVLVAPEHEKPIWTDLIERFDRRQPVDTRTYTPRSFSIDEVRALIEATARDDGPRGSGDQWKLVADELTGALIVTATPSEHENIEALFERLDAVPGDTRRPMRLFPIRNRPVDEIIGVLSQLVDAGVFAEGGDAATGVIDESRSRSPASPVSPAGGTRQRTLRDVLPPGARSTLLAPPGGAAAEYMDSESRRRTSLLFGSGLTLMSDAETNTLIAIGDARRLAQIEQLIERLDVRQAQVELEVLVIGLSDGETLDLGAEFEKLEISGSTLISLSSLFGLGLTGLTEDATGTGSGFTGVALNPGDFRILIRALETLNEGRSLNRPRVLVNNNQAASLDSVLQAPFLSTNAANTIATTSFGGTQDAGTTVTVTPHIAEGDHLVLEYSVSLSTFVGESSDPALPPPRQQNNLQSVVTIPDGYTIAVGGLEMETTAEAVSQIPLLGDIPIIGEAFKSRSKSTTRSRFYVFIRANILRHGGFEDLKYISDQQVAAAEIDDGWPVVHPQVIR